MGKLVKQEEKTVGPYVALKSYTIWFQVNALQSMMPPRRGLVHEAPLTRVWALRSQHLLSEVWLSSWPRPWSNEKVYAMESAEGKVR